MGGWGQLKGVWVSLPAWTNIDRLLDTKKVQLRKIIKNHHFTISPKYVFYFEKREIYFDSVKFLKHLIFGYYINLDFLWTSMILFKTTWGTLYLKSELSKYTLSTEHSAANKLCQNFIILHFNQNVNKRKTNL